jgi:hypothetical protein
MTLASNLITPKHTRIWNVQYLINRPDISYMAEIWAVFWFIDTIIALMITINECLLSKFCLRHKILSYMSIYGAWLIITGLDCMIGFIEHSFTITRNQNKLQKLTINDCLGLAPFWLDYDWLHSGISLFWSQLWLTSLLVCLLLASVFYWSELRVRVRVRVSLRLAVYRQSVRLGDKPLETTTSNIIFQLNTCGHSP